MDKHPANSSPTAPPTLSSVHRSLSSAAAAPVHANDKNTILATASSSGSAAETTIPGTGEDTRHIPPKEDLITFPRFKPHALTRPTLFSTDSPASGVLLHEAGILTGEGGEQGGEGDRGGGGGGGGLRATPEKGAGPDGVKLLNAWEKIKELEELVESSRSHNER